MSALFLALLTFLCFPGSLLRPALSLPLLKAYIPAATSALSCTANNILQTSSFLATLVQCFSFSHVPIILSSTVASHISAIILLLVFFKFSHPSFPTPLTKYPHTPDPKYTTFILSHSITSACNYFIPFSFIISPFLRIFLLIDYLHSLTLPS